MKTALALLAVAVGLVAVGCGKKSSGGGPEVTWVYDAGLTFKKVPSEQADAVRKHFEGLKIVLVLHGDNSYDLKVEGGPEPEVSTGTYKTTFDGVRLVTTTRDGKPVPADEAERTLISDGHTMTIRLKGMGAVLSRR